MSDLQQLATQAQFSTVVAQRNSAMDKIAELSAQISVLQANNAALLSELEKQQIGTEDGRSDHDTNDESVAGADRS